MARQFNKPWKRIYGTDRGYTARVDRVRQREAERTADTAAMTGEIARYSTVPSEEFVTVTDFYSALTTADADDGSEIHTQEESQL